MRDTCQVPGCSRPAEIQYDVDPRRPKRICGRCDGRLAPEALASKLRIKPRAVTLPVTCRPYTGEANNESANG